MIERKPSTAGIDGRTLKDLRIANEVSREAFAQLLDVPAATLDAWEDGAAIPDAMASRIAHVSRLVRHNSLSAWKHRVALASGMEILIGADLRIAAISRVALNTPFARELKIDIPASVFLGAHMHSVLPNLDCTLVVNHGTGLNDLLDIGFFAGEIRLVRIAAEINFGIYAYCGVFEYWPIETCDAGIVARQVSVLDLTKRTSLRQPGILVQDVEIARSDARGIPSPLDRNLVTA
jgi:DNA-binding XRE family transcriptional regulator